MLEETPQPSQNSDTDMLMMQNEKNHGEMTHLLDTLLSQNENNNHEPILETMVHQNEAIKEAVSSTGDKVTEAIKESSSEIEKIVGAVKSIADLLPNIGFLKGNKGEKGEDGKNGIDGKTPIPGVDFPIPKDGVDGKPGVDGRDGRNGEDAEVDYPALIAEILPKIPVPQNGKDGSPDTGKDIVKKLEELEGKDRLSYDALKNAPDFALLQRLVSSRDYDFLELKDVPSSYSGQGGKIVSVKTDGTGLEFITNGGGSSGTPRDNNIFTSENWVASAGITTITLPSTPISGSVKVFLNGRRELPVAYDTLGYTISGLSVTFPYEFDSTYIAIIDYRE